MSPGSGLLWQSLKLSVEHVDGLGKTFVANEDIDAGEMLVRERPSIVATLLHKLPRELRAKFRSGAEELENEGLMLSLDDLLIIHAFARVDENTRRRALEECCGAEVCEEDHEIVMGAKKAARWCKANDPACEDIELADLERCVCVFALNAFGFLADGASGGATSLFVRGAKFTHRCLRPSVVFHGQSGSLCFRATRSISAGEVPTISYLGRSAQCGSERRRRLLQDSKGFACGCVDCQSADSYRLLPCSRCCGARDTATGLLTADAVRRLAVAIEALPFEEQREFEAAKVTTRNGGLPAQSFIDSPFSTKVEYLHWLRSTQDDAIADGSAAAVLDSASPLPMPVKKTPPQGRDAEAWRSKPPSAPLPVMRRHGSPPCPPCPPCPGQAAPEGLWVCDACGLRLSDAEIDVPCASPERGDSAWIGSASAAASVGGAGGASPLLGTSARDGRWALQLPAGRLLSWETQVEESVHNLQAMVLEEPLARAAAGMGGADDEGSARVLGSLRRLPSLLGGVVAVLGPAHGSVHQLLETQLDHWVELVMAAAQDAPEGFKESPEAMGRAEAALLTALRDEASCDGFQSCRELFDALWERTELLWRLRSIHQHEELWEVVQEVLEALEAWGVRDAVLGTSTTNAFGEDDDRSRQHGVTQAMRLGRLGRAQAMVSMMAERAALEYGDESDDAAAMHELEVKLRRNCRVSRRARTGAVPRA